MSAKGNQDARPVSTVTVVIVNYRTAEKTARCIRSILNCTDEGIDIVVVDNASDDGSAEALAEQFPEVTLLRTTRNLGFAGGVNLGAASARGDFVLLLNSDATVHPGAIGRIRSFATFHAHHGVYGGRAIHPDGTLDPSTCWGRPTLWSLAMFAVGATAIAPRSKLLNPESLGDWKRDSYRIVPVVSGCFLLTRLETWKSLGGLDERYFMYSEDVDLCARAEALGYSPIIVPDAVITHELGGSSSSPGVKACMVLAGKITFLSSRWGRISNRLGRLFLMGGVGVRALIQNATGQHDGNWAYAWRCRRDWELGYPTATERLGLAPQA